MRFLSRALKQVIELEEQKQVAWCKNCHIVLGEPKEKVDVKELFHRCTTKRDLELGDIEIIPQKKISHIGTPCQGGRRHTDCIKENCWCGCHRRRLTAIPPLPKGSGSLAVA
jgi:hypothetical protein